MKKFFFALAIIILGWFVFFGFSNAVGIRVTYPPQTRLPDGFVGQAYTEIQFKAEGGDVYSYKWQLDSGPLPPGLQLNSVTGKLSGTLTAPIGGITTDFAFSLLVSDNSGKSGISPNYRIKINIESGEQPLPGLSPPSLRPTITTNSVPGGIKGQQYSFTFKVGGGSPQPDYEWFAGIKKPPSGLSLSSEGVLFGVPLADGSFVFDVAVRDKKNLSLGTDSRSFTITIGSVSSLQVSPSSLEDGVLTQEYRQTLAVSGGAPPYVWSVIKPLGLTYKVSGVNKEILTIEGKPEVSGDNEITISVDDSLSPPNNFNKTYQIKVTLPGAVSPPPAASTGQGKSACEGKSLTVKNARVYTAPGGYAAYEGLVPCGKCVVVKSAEIKTGSTVDGPGKYVSCQFCHFQIMFAAIINFLLFMVIVPLAVLFIVIGGLMYVFSAGDMARINKAKSMIIGVSVGLAIVFGAWMIINVFFSLIGLSDFAIGLTGPGNWFKIPCGDIKLQ